MPAPHIHCTAKAATWLGVRKAEPISDADAWSLNVFPHHGRRCVLITHAAKCYMLALDVRKADLLPFDAFFAKLLRRQLLAEWPGAPIAVQRYLATLGPAQLSTSNNDKRTLGVMNRYVEQLTYKLVRDEPTLDATTATHLAWNENNGLVSRPTGARRSPSQRPYITPAEEMARLLGIPYERIAHTERLRRAQHGRWGLN
jgi:hypothetical protein